MYSSYERVVRVRIFYSFLVVFSVAILFMLPIGDGIYDFRTDVKEDKFNVTTGGATTTANVTLYKSVYNADSSTIAITSDAFADIPVLVAYNSTTRKTDISGLAISTSRTLTVSYDYDALNASGAITVLLDKLQWIWLICVIAFAPAALASLFLKKD
jgi:hypothetical protein